MGRVGMQSVFPIPDLNTQIHKCIIYFSGVILETLWCKKSVIIDQILRSCNSNLAHIRQFSLIQAPLTINTCRMKTHQPD